uniref:Ubiquitin-associated protein 2-like n=1 Tax=Gadus morhua TaxID=8049 RepID=A0A8C5CCX2_GADMO
MMTSVVSSPARATRERTLPTSTQTTQKQIQATADQIRLAQVTFEKKDADFEDKVKQLSEVSGKTQDECGIALHDCNDDVNRAINFLLESPSDTTSWETVGKRRSVGKEAGPSEIKERRGGEREASRVRGGANRRGRGISRGRDGNYAGRAGVSKVLFFSFCHQGKAPPNLAQGVPPLLANQYIMGPGGLLPAYPIYGYEELQMLQSRLPMDYYGMTFPGTTAAMPGRDGLANNPYSGEATKFGRGDSSSPAPPTSLSTGGVQSQGQQPLQAGGYGYTGLPYYAGMPGVPSAFQYGPTVFVPPATAKQQSMGLANPSSQYHQQHQPSYGQHAYGTAFDDLSQAHAGEYNKGGYGSSAQSQVKASGSGPGKGLSGSGSSGVPDMGGSIYNKTQSFDKQGFHTGTPPPFSLPSALGGTGPLNPGGAPGYAPAPFLHILPHQQPHSQLLHHHMAQDGQVMSFRPAASPTIAVLLIGPTE